MHLARQGKFETEGRTTPMTVVTPGEKVGSASEYGYGSGVYESNGVLYASIVGRLERVTEPKQNETNGSGGQQLLKVTAGTLGGIENALLPCIGSLVTARVTKVNPRAAHTEVLIQDGRPLGAKFKGTIRQQDVRKTEIDKVEIYKCFSPGDIVRARVLSLGDRHSYYLTTADNSLGVVEARSSHGTTMVPVTWQEMQCPRTGIREFRKVAKAEPNQPIYNAT